MMKTLLFKIIGAVKFYNESKCFAEFLKLFLSKRALYLVGYITYTAYRKLSELQKNGGQTFFFEI